MWISSRELHIFTLFSVIVLRCDSASVSADFGVSKSGRSSIENRRIAASRQFFLHIAKKSPKSANFDNFRHFVAKSHADTPVTTEI